MYILYHIDSQTEETPTSVIKLSYDEMSCLEVYQSKFKVLKMKILELKNGFTIKDEETCHVTSEQLWNRSKEGSS